MKKIVFLISLSIAFVACSTPEVTISNINEAVKLKRLGVAYCDNFASKANSDSLYKVALLFKALANVQEIHANQFLDLLNKEQISKLDTVLTPSIATDSTLANLYRVYANSQYEYYNLYPEFVETAQKEKFRRATKAFNLAIKSTLKQIEVIQQTISSVEKNKNDSTICYAWSVCNKCGDLLEGQVNTNKKCDVCGSMSFFIFR